MIYHYSDVARYPHRMQLSNSEYELFSQMTQWCFDQFGQPYNHYAVDLSILDLNQDLPAQDNGPEVWDFASPLNMIWFLNFTDYISFKLRWDGTV